MIVELILKGEAPLVMHNSRLADPLDPITAELKKRTSLHSSKKTDEVFMEIMALEWAGGLYYDPKIGPFIPAENIASAIFEGAGTASKQKPVKRALRMLATKVPLKYDGPRDKDELYTHIVKHADGTVRPFILTKILAVNDGNRIARTRPQFPNWSLSTFVYIDTKKVNPEVVENAFKSAGEDVGLGDGRPRYGLFDPTWKPRPDLKLEDVLTQLQ